MNLMDEKQYNQYKGCVGVPLGDLCPKINPSADLDFRKIIKDLCEKLNLAAYTVAKLAGLKSPATLYNYLNGESSLSSDNLTKVLNFLRDAERKQTHE